MARWAGVVTIRLVFSVVLLAYVAAAVVCAWGAARIAPTRAVAAGFEPISLDNRRILVMEWIADRGPGRARR